MRPMGRNSEAKTRKVSPPQASYMSNDQFANYLAELRNNRVSRPGGARPQPAGSRPAPTRYSTGRASIDTTASSQPDPATIQRAPSQATSIGASSMTSRYSTVSGRGRDYYPAHPSPSPLKPSEVVPSATYMERGQRWMEKEEAHSLRDAMDEMSLKDQAKEAKRTGDSDDERLYDAALDEAAELVWQHQNGVPRKPEGPYRYKPHLRKNSYAHARAASAGQYGDEIEPSGLARGSGSRSVSGSSTDSDGASRRSRPSLDTRQSSGQAHSCSNGRNKSYGSVGGRSARHSDIVPRRSSMKRNISGEIARPFSGDQIWEEPETIAASPRTSAEAAATPNALRAAHPSNRVRFDSQDDVKVPKQPLDRVEIYRNPPSQSRNALYTTNSGSPALQTEDEVPKKDGKEIRGDDIRAATSMKLKDRSPNLPEPTAVSDTPGRPIVSFDANWRPQEESTDTESERNPTTGPQHTQGQQGRQPVAVPAIMVEEEDAQRKLPTPPSGVPSISVAGCDDDAGMDIPTINVPTIAIDGDVGATPGVPMIITPDDQQGKQSQTSRPLPTPGKPKIAQKPRGHWSPDPNAVRRATAICHECAYPIDGRFVALAGCQERFHPQCLACYCCGTRLEAMEISPEPDATRKARLDRIARRAGGEILPEDPGMTMAEDGDDRLRFYCHLDWHENFAPQCKHCKTPILEEHIVALGEHWHYGHFFCAECGDPFEHGMTHIEKDGYAWCIKCQTKRTERRAPKCKKCRLAVIGEYVQALGGEWHDACFRCATCQGGFDDGQIFPKETAGGGTLVLCTACRMRELKM